MFDLTRFGRLAGAWWAENRRATLWFFGIGVIVHFVLMLVIFSGNRGFVALDTDGQEGFYFVGLFLTAPIFAGRFFQAMARRESELVFLMRPASLFEKWLLALLIVAVGYLLAYALAFYVCNLPASLLASSLAAKLVAAADVSASQGNADLDKFGLFLPWRAFDGWKAALPVLLILWSVQGFAVLGSLYFRAMPFIKTILSAFFILLACIFTAMIFDSRPEQFFGFWSIKQAIPPWRQIYFPLVWFGVPILLWLACFSALREREAV
jgi:hypothetical protein